MPDSTAELATAVRTLALSVVAGFVGVMLAIRTDGAPARLGLLHVVIGILLAGTSYLDAGGVSGTREPPPEQVEPP